MLIRCSRSARSLSGKRDAVHLKWSVHRSRGWVHRVLRSPRGISFSKTAVPRFQENTLKHMILTVFRTIAYACLRTGFPSIKTTSALSYLTQVGSQRVASRSDCILARNCITDYKVLHQHRFRLGRTEDLRSLSRISYSRWTRADGGRRISRQDHSARTNVRRALFPSNLCGMH